MRVLATCLRLLAISLLSEAEWSPTVRWVDELETLDPIPRFRGEQSGTVHNLGPVNVCDYQQDPADEQDRHVPRYWKNRLDEQISRGVHPTVLDGHSEVDWEPLGETDLRFLERRRLDIYAICYPGQFSPVRYRDPIRAMEHLADLCTEERRPERFCRTCRAYDAHPDGGNAYRPTGAIERSSCAGCLVSYVDKLERDPEEVQEEKIVEWLTARERLKDVEARKAHAHKPREKKRLKREREKAIERVKEAAEECRMAGFDLKTEFKRRPERWVDAAAT